MRAKTIFFPMGVILMLLSCDRDQLQNTTQESRLTEKNQSVKKETKDSLNLNGEINSPEQQHSISPEEEPKIPPRK